MVIKAMPIAVAKKAVGKKNPNPTKEGIIAKKEKMSEEMLKNREEFELNEDSVSKGELFSWYGECPPRPPIGLRISATHSRWFDSTFAKLIRRSSNLILQKPLT